MRRLALAPALVVALLLVAGPATAQTADRAGSTVFDFTDKKNDVFFFKNTPGASPAQRRSIDIRRLRVIKRTHTVRFIINIKQISTARKFDQIAVILLTQRRESTGVSGEIGFSAQNRLVDSYASIIDDNTFEPVVTCEPLNPKAQKGKRQFRVDVPLECIPPGHLRVSLEMVAGKGYAGTGKDLYSSDSLNVRKAKVLNP